VQVIDRGLTPHFKLSEMACQDGSPLLITPKVVEHAQRMEKFRIWYNRPIVPTSWHRSPDWNLRVNGSITSKHLEGIATDFLYPKEWQLFDKNRKKEFLYNVKEKWKSLDGGAVLVYSWGIHLDSRDYFVYKEMEVL
jgi:hypothetical protein